MKDIETRSDIETLMRAFYKRVFTDKVIGFIFTDVAHMDLEHHLPIITDFWENVLFNTGVYKGNPMEPHFDLNQKVPFEAEYFERWLSLFCETVNENFCGEYANLACMRAKSIAAIMQSKLALINQGKLH